jgi:hypothetical protein
MQSQQGPAGHNLVLTAVLLALVPIAFALAIVAAGYPIVWVALVAGALGWLIGLAARTPVILVATRVLGRDERALPVIIAASGPAEETVRVLALLLVGRDLSTALWLGFGWTTVEIAYTYVNAIAVAALVKRDDPEARRALKLIPPAALSDDAPWWSAVERAGVSALHIGFTLIVAVMPIAFVITAIAHSTFNVVVTRLGKTRSILAVETLVCVTGAVFLLVGLAMMGVLEADRRP